MKTIQNFDVIIVGGSYSGLSAALVLARMSRKVLIIDEGKPCNRFALKSHNFLPYDGDEQINAYKDALRKVLRYPTVWLVRNHAVSGKKLEDGFSINTKSGKTYASKKIILATGVVDILPDIEGFKECWGSSVIHCPYCHGYELKKKKTVILGDSVQAFQMAGIMLNFTDDLSILTNGKAKFTEEQISVLNKNNIKTVETEIEKFLHHENQLTHIVFKNKNKLSAEVVFSIVEFKQHSSNLLAQFRLNYTENGLIKIDHHQRTGIKGIFACGDNSSAMRSVSKAVFTGNLAGAMVNQELIDESFT